MTDPFDDLFDRWDGPSVDGTHAHSTYEALVPGFRRARTRRRLQLSGAAAVVVALAVGTPVVLSGLDDTPGTVTETDVADGTTDDAPASEADDADAPDQDDAPDPTTGDITEPAETEDVADPIDDPTTTTVPELPDDDSSDDDAADPVDDEDDPADGADPTPSTTTAPPPSTTVDPGPDDSDDTTEDETPDAGPTVIRSPGGTVTVSITGGVIVIDDVDAAAGFVAETETSGDEAEVEFKAQSSETDDVKIRIDIVDGGLVWTVDDHHEEGHEEPSE